MSNYIDPRQKILWHTGKLDQIRRTGTTNAPVNVEIDLSNRCSHGCKWCHFAYTHKRGPLAGKRERPHGAIDSGDLMSYDMAARILGQLVDTGVKSVTWSGGGEPTLHPQFDAIVRLASMLGLQQGLYTHGGHIDADRAALLKDVMTFVYVSLDECSRLAFKQNKGVDRFDNVLLGISNLVEADGPATVGVGFLLSNHNHHDIPTMVWLGKSLGVDYMQFRPVIDYDQDAPGERVGFVGWVDDALSILEPLASDTVLVDADRFRMYRDWTGHSYKTCNWSAMQTVISPNGKVWRCTNKREHHGALLGDLAVSTFADVWARFGGACAVDGGCRVMCRGALANVTLDAVMSEPKHKDFV